MEAKKIDLKSLVPPVFDKNNHFGKFYVQPIESFVRNERLYVKNILWRLKFDAKSHTPYWGDPKIEEFDHGKAD